MCVSVWWVMRYVRRPCGQSVRWCAVEGGSLAKRRTVVACARSGPETVWPVGVRVSGSLCGQGRPGPAVLTQVSGSLGVKGVCDGREGACTACGFTPWLGRYIGRKQLGFSSPFICPPGKDTPIYYRLQLVLFINWFLVHMCWSWNFFVGIYRCDIE